MLNLGDFRSALTTTGRNLPIVILYVTEGCNLQCITCSYRMPREGELSIDELRSVAAQLKEAGLREIVYSGGEPLLRRDFPEICRLFEGPRIKQTLLTNGLLLEKRLDEILPFIDEIIVSVDGPTGEIHNLIRGGAAFDRIARGVSKAVQRSSTVQVSIRTVIQKQNFRHLGAMTELAQQWDVSRISFLAVDVLSGSFGRIPKGLQASHAEVILDAREVNEFREIVDVFTRQFDKDFESGFIAEPPAKFLHMAQYFEALLGNADFPVNLCNAPMVSAVITSTGELLPCFFLPGCGNVRSNTVREILDGDTMRNTRKSVRDYAFERCRTCVCSLHVSPVAALLGRF